MIKPEFAQSSEINYLSELLTTALAHTYDLHESLGEAGVNDVETNQFGDTAMVADVQSERIMLDALRTSGETFIVHSEEHGKLAIPGNDPTLSAKLAVMDGLDGSSLYKKARGTGNYGTMFAIFENDKPVYGEYSVAGIMLHSTAQLLVARRGQGVTLRDFRTGQEESVTTSGAELTAGALVYVDDDVNVPKDNTLYPYFQTNLEVFAKPLRRTAVEPQRTGASAGYYASLAMGEALIVGEATRKGNLELAAAYALVKEAGGSIIDVKSWQDIGDRKFLEYGQNSHEPFVAVANPAALQTLKAIIGENAGARAVR